MKTKKYLLFIITLSIMNVLSNVPQSEAAANPASNNKVVKRVGSIIKLRPEFEERYVILHRNVFPGVLKSIRKSNVRNYSIYLLDGILFSYFEYSGKNYDSDMKSIGDAITKDWWKLTEPMQEPLHTRKAGEWWAEMELLRQIDKQTKPYQNAKRFAAVVELVPGAEIEFRIILKNLLNDLDASIKKMQIQNINLYLKDGSVYLYYEFTGKNYDTGKTILINNVKFQSGLKKYLRSDWKEMKEVFHTD